MPGVAHVLLHRKLPGQVFFFLIVKAREFFGNKQNSTAVRWGLGAQCLCVQDELPSCVHKQTPHQHTFSFALGSQNNVPMSKNKQTSITQARLSLPPSLRLKEPQALPGPLQERWH
jgi:hypothetical protein